LKNAAYADTLSSLAAEYLQIMDPKTETKGDSKMDIAEQMGSKTSDKKETLEREYHSRTAH
jgi:hypothetical protein